MKLIKWWLLIPIGLIVIGFIGTEVNKAYWDAKVRELCEKDGGVTVYAKVILTQEEYKKYGGIRGAIPVPGENSSIAMKFEYLSRMDEVKINGDNPQVRRSEYVIFRKSDNKNIGKLITYSRSGGDFPTIIAHPSGFGCEDIPGFETDIEKKIFIIEGEE